MDGALRGVNGTIFAYGQNVVGQDLHDAGRRQVLRRRRAGPHAPRRGPHLFRHRGAVRGTDFLLRGVYLRDNAATLAEGHGGTHIDATHRLIRGDYVEGAQGRHGLFAARVLQVYNEQLRDLLAGDGTGEKRRGGRAGGGRRRQPRPWSGREAAGRRLRAARRF